MKSLNTTLKEKRNKFSIHEGEEWDIIYLPKTISNLSIVISDINVGENISLRFDCASIYMNTSKGAWQ